MTQLLIPNPYIKYDKNYDILYVYYTPATPAYDDEDFPGVIIRRSMIDERIVGVQIFDYSSHSIEFLRKALPFLDLDKIAGFVRATQ